MLTYTDPTEGQADMMTVRQIERLWTGRFYDRLLGDLLANRPEQAIRPRAGGSALLAAAAAMIRLDELSQSDAPIFTLLLRTLLAAQDADGGWGDLLTTPWAIRALLVDAGAGAALERGLAFLASLQQVDGIWPGIPIRRLPADPWISACILFHLGDSPRFRASVRLPDAVKWFARSASALDPDTRSIWELARPRCVMPRLNDLLYAAGSPFRPSP